MEKLIVIPHLLVGAYFIRAVFVQRTRGNWAGKDIKMGAAFSPGFGILFFYSAILVLFFPLPFERFISMLLAIAPLVGAAYLVVKGYKTDFEEHEATNKQD